MDLKVEVRMKTSAILNKKELKQMFNPKDYIVVLDEGMVLCTNPVADGGLSAITVNTGLRGDRKRAFQDAIRRMVLNKLFSPKFAEVILAATEMSFQQEREFA